MHHLKLQQQEAYHFSEEMNQKKIRQSTNTCNPVSRSSVSVAWLVMPVHWIRDEHTYIVLSEINKIHTKTQNSCCTSVRLKYRPSFVFYLPPPSSDLKICTPNCNSFFYWINTNTCSAQDRISSSLQQVRVTLPFHAMEFRQVCVVL